MAKRGRRSAKSERKREAKKRFELRAHSGSIYKRVGTAGELVACCINAHWREDGLASIHVLRRIPGGGHASASFLVDTSCLGLKDAWGRLDTSYEEFNSGIIEGMSRTLEMGHADLELARRLVAGGIRFAYQNGFRLPPRFDRWTALLGDIGDWRTADLTDFGEGGRLRYVGTKEELKRRLVGCSVEEFLARDDVDFIMGEDDLAYLDD